MNPDEYALSPAGRILAKTAFLADLLDQRLDSLLETLPPYLTCISLFSEHADFTHDRKRESSSEKALGEPYEYGILAPEVEPVDVRP